MGFPVDDRCAATAGVPNEIAFHRGPGAASRIGSSMHVANVGVGGRLIIFIIMIISSIIILGQSVANAYFFPFVT